MDRGKRNLARAKRSLARLGGGIKTSMAAVWIIAGAIGVATALMWAAHSSPVPPGARRAPKPTNPKATTSAAPTAPPTAPAGRVEPPIRADLVVYYHGDFRSNLEPCG
jgi:hypothetical protein